VVQLAPNTDPSPATDPRTELAATTITGALATASFGALGLLLAGRTRTAAGYALVALVLTGLRVGLRGRCHAAIRWALLASMVGTLIGLAPFTGGLFGPSTPLWPLVVALTALLFGRWLSLAVATVGVGTAVVAHGLGATPPSLQAPYEWLGVFAASLFLVGQAVGRTVERLTEAVDMARAHQGNAVQLLAQRDEEIGRRTAVEGRLQDALVEARQANKAKSQFLASMSHELRTPLNAIIGYAEILEEEALPDSDEASDLARIRTAGKHLLGLINDVLDLSKIEAGRMTLLPTTVDLDQCVREAIETVMPAAERRGNRLQLDAADLGAIFADGMRLRQILLNLLSNAVKFTEHGEVVLFARRVDVDGREHVRFVVRDTGIGVSEDARERLFRPFTQADSSTSRKFGGTGLGLVLCRRFAEMMEGRVTLESELGRGTTVTFELPTETQVSALARLQRTRLAELATVRDQERPVVLCIDDEASALHLLDRMLREEGVHPIPCSDPTLAIDLAMEVQPNVITLDLHMPNLDGAQLLRLLKEHPTLADVPVVVLSVDGGASSTLDIGAAAWMRKPVDRGHLLSLIESLGRDAAAPVMVVDDDAPTRDVLVRMLEAGGIPTIQARDGLEALGLLENLTPRMMLLDLMMPEMDGFQVAEALRADPRWVDLPVVVLTSATLDAADRERLAQCSTVLGKDEETLRNLVREVKRVA
jgi:signal transduction histidine kinase/CheY-like chemotaxis protein